MSKSAGESGCSAHDVVIGIRTRLQVNSYVSDKLAVRLSSDVVVKRFPIRGPETGECMRRAFLGDGEKYVGEDKLVVTGKPQNRGSVVITDPDVLPIGPNYLSILLSYSHTSPSVSIYKKTVYLNPPSTHPSVSAY